MPYFDADAGLGIVQSPQHFRVLGNQDWLERGAGAVQEFLLPLRPGFSRVPRRRDLRRHERDLPSSSARDERRAAAHRTLRGRAHGIRPPSPEAGCPSPSRDLRAWRLPTAHLTSFVAQQYRWCMGSMSLLGSAKFWKAKQPLRNSASATRAAFPYYVHTALFTFIGPVIPLLLLSLHSETVRLRNYVLDPAGNRVTHSCCFRSGIDRATGSKLWAVKMIYGWAHAFALGTFSVGPAEAGSATGGRGSRQGGHRPPRLVGHRALGRWRRRGRGSRWPPGRSPRTRWFELPARSSSAALFYALVVVRSLTSTHARRPSGRLRWIKPVAARTGLNVM